MDASAAGASVKPDHDQHDRLVVVEVDDVLAVRLRRRRPLAARRQGLRLGNRRQEDVEGAALAQQRLHGDAAVVGHHDPVDHG